MTLRPLVPQPSTRPPGMDVRLVTVPYDSGQRGARMGAGPEHLLRAGLAERLAARGHRASVAEVALAPDAFPVEAGAAFALQRLLADAVRDAVAAGALPVVLAGNCNTAVGTVAGLGPAARDVVWLDAHGDFNTPETTIGGFLDGMALAMLCGQCWRRMTAQVKGFAPVDEDSVLLVGARDLDPPEAERLAASRVRRVTVKDAAAELGAALGGASRGDRGAYLHLDLDVLDPAEAVVNGYAAPGGLASAEVEAIIRVVGARRRLEAVAVTAFDPALDTGGRNTAIACRLVEAAVEAAAAAAARSRSPSPI